jgi:hypothetical protein
MCAWDGSMDLDEGNGIDVNATDIMFIGIIEVNLNPVTLITAYGHVNQLGLNLIDETRKLY